MPSPSPLADALLAFMRTVPVAEQFPTIVPEAKETFTRDPFAFLIACCLDRGMPSQIVWTIPYDLDRALGHLDPARIAALSGADLSEVLRGLPHRPRYLNAAPRTLREVAALVVGDFGGRAEQVWEGRSAGAVRGTLRRVHGVGPGIANMTVLLIERFYGVRFSDLDRRGMDIKADVHTMRVLYRLGAATAIGEREATEGARRLRPEYPGEIDAPLWVIGRRWCHATGPDCGTCVVSPSCQRQGV